MKEISLPNNWDPRPDQMEMWRYLERGGVRCDVVAHRRFGKDDVSLHRTAVAAHEKIGNYWHMLPEAAQARKAIWDAVNPATGLRRIDEAFPKALRANTREQDMMIRFKNGSTWQVLGSDNYNSYVGSPPVGVVFSEWSLAKPDAWTYIRPILLQNGGWAIFIWTPRGKNHATRAFEGREQDPTWFTRRIPATITSVFTPEQLEQEKRELIREFNSEQEGLAKFNQEYMVDFNAAAPGSYYAHSIELLRAAGKINSGVIYDPRYLVDTAWDLGIDDYTSIWFFQRKPTGISVIDFYETSDMGLQEIVARGIKPKLYKFGHHFLPHDVVVRELGAGGRSRRETLHSMGVRPIRVGVAKDPEERINASRRMLPWCEFNYDRCRVGIEHLEQYAKKWNASLSTYGGPKHDEHSHASDAFGEYAVNARLPDKEKLIVKVNPSDRWAELFRQSKGESLNWKTV